MAACEVCWDMAYIRSRMDGRSQADHYRELLAENAGDEAHLAEAVELAARRAADPALGEGDPTAG